MHTSILQKTRSRSSEEHKGLAFTWTPKVCRIIAFWAIFRGLGHYFTYFRGLGGVHQLTREKTRSGPPEEHKALGFRV